MFGQSAETWSSSYPDFTEAALYTSSGWNNTPPTFAEKSNSSTNDYLIRQTSLSTGYYYRISYKLTSSASGKTITVRYIRTNVQSPTISDTVQLKPSSDIILSNTPAYPVTNEFTIGSAGTYYLGFWVHAGNNGTKLQADSFRILSLVKTPQLAAPVTIGSNSFDAQWNTITNATGYYLDVSLNSTFSSFVSGYNNLYIDGGATSSATVSGLNTDTSYYYRVRATDGSSISRNPSGFATLVTGQAGSGALPIELISFTAEEIDGKVLIEWITATEINNDYFTIERSANGVDFNPIAYVPAAGNSNKKLSYSITDENPLNGLSYYRLKQTDYDGTHTYSEVVSTFVGKASLEISGLAVTGYQLSFYCCTSDGFITAEIYNLAGKLVASDRILTTKGYSKKFIELSNIPQGLYLLRVNDGTNTVVKKFVF